MQLRLAACPWLQVALGMSGLSECGIVHRDLAARNVLLGPRLVAKVRDAAAQRPPPRALGLMRMLVCLYVCIIVWQVADFGLSRQVGGAGRKDYYRMTTHGGMLPLRCVRVGHILLMFLPTCTAPLVLA